MSQRTQPSGHRSPDRMRRQVIILTMLLIAVLVMLFYFRAWLDGLAESTVAIEPEPEPLVEPPPEPELIVEQDVDAPQPLNEIRSPALAQRPAPERVILLPARVANPDPVAEALVIAIRGATLRVLQGSPGIEVVDVSAAEYASIVPSNAGTLRQDRLVHFVMARYYDGNVVAEVSIDSPQDSGRWSISTYAQRGNRLFGSSSPIVKDVAQRQGADPDSLGTSFARRILEEPGRVTTADTEYAQAVLSDATSLEQDRLLAYPQLLQSESHSAEALASAIDLAAHSLSPQVRLRAWTVIRQNAFDPMLAGPLSNALLTDPDASVRREVAQGLAYYLVEGGSRPVLEHAARNDASNEVRVAARMALMDFDEQQTFKRETLLDRSLTPAERFAPTRSFANDGPLQRNSGATELAEEAIAYAEIVNGTDDAILKRDALERLMRTTVSSGRSIVPNADPEIIRALVESAAAPNDQVQRMALTVMLQHSQHPEVRAVLEAVVENDPQLAAELRIERTLAPSRANDLLLPPTVR